MTNNVRLLMIRCICSERLRISVICCAVEILVLVRVLPRSHSRVAIRLRWEHFRANIEMCFIKRPPCSCFKEHCRHSAIYMSKGESTCNFSAKE